MPKTKKTKLYPEAFQVRHITSVIYLLLQVKGISGVLFTEYYLTLETTNESLCLHII